MWRGCLFMLGLVCTAIALGFVYLAINAAQTKSLDPELGGEDVTPAARYLAGAVFCCPALIFGAFALFSFSEIDGVIKERRREKRERAMLNEVQSLRRQTAQPQTSTQSNMSEDDVQIKLAGKLWKEGKRVAAIEILESMPFNERAQAILVKLRTQK